MSILVIGINHKTASIAVREKAYFPMDKLTLYLRDLLNLGCTQEAVLLSTCNRSELYCEANDAELLSIWFREQTKLSPEDFAQLAYIYRDEAALTHIMQVACGLDSMVLGESQILGQMKEAFSESCTANAVGPLFHRLFRRVFELAKEIRTTTAIGACPVSVASAAIHFAKEKCPNFQAAKVSIIGAGNTAELLMRYLKSVKPIKQAALINRSLHLSSTLLKNFASEIYDFGQLVQALARADIVFSATGSPLPIVTKEAMLQVMKLRKYKPIILIDIAVPRDIEPSVADIDHVSLYCIDDLKTIIEKNRLGREHAAIKAQEMIIKNSTECMIELKSFDKISHAIRAYRTQIEGICRHELIKAKQKLHRGVAADQVLDDFAHAFIKKLLHAPSVQLRQAGVEGRFELLNFAKQLFTIPDADIECL